MAKVLFQKNNKFGRGRPRVSKEVRAIRNLADKKFEQAFIRFMTMNYRELKKLMVAEDCSAVDLLIAKTIDKGIRTGNPKVLELVLDRILGKPRLVDSTIHKENISCVVLPFESAKRVI